MLLLLCCLLAQGEFPKMSGSVPQEWWDVSSEVEKYDPDAVVLLDITVIDPKTIGRFRRVRILREEGREALSDLIAERFKGEVTGRVIDRSSGEVSVIDGDKDLIEMTIAQRRRKKLRAKILIPSGVTNDCLVELRWTIKINNGTTSGWNDTYAMSEPWPIRDKRFFHNMSQDERYINFIRPGKDVGFSSDGYDYPKNLFFKDIPPEGTYPFSGNLPKYWAATSISSLSFSRMRFTRYIADNMIPKKIKTKGYKEWTKQLKANMPSDPAQRAEFLVRAMHQRVPNVAQLSPEKRLEITALRDRYPRNKAAQKALEDGYGDSYQQQVLFAAMARDLEIDAWILMTGDRDDHIPNLTITGYLGMDLNKWFFGFGPTMEEMVHFDISQPDISVPNLPIDVQGLTAMAFRVDDAVSMDITLPRDRYDRFRWEHRYRTKITESGTVETRFTQINPGPYRLRFVNRYKNYSEADRDDAVRRGAERLWSSHTVSDVTLDMQADQTVVRYKATRSTHTPHEYRMMPFRGAYAPINRPTRWSSGRNQPLLLDHFQQLDTHTVTLPDGWKTVGNPSWDRRNTVGRVAIGMQQNGNTLTIQRIMEVYRPIYQASHEEELKALLAWIDEAEDQRLLIKKPNENGQGP